VNLNATLFAQLVVFFILALFTMKYVWPPLMKALDERANKISEIVDAERRAAEIIEEAKRHAAEEAAGIIEAARHDAAAEATRLRDALRNDVASLAVKGAEQILRREVNATAHADLLEQLKAEL